MLPSNGLSAAPNWKRLNISSNDRGEYSECTINTVGLNDKSSCNMSALRETANKSISAKVGFIGETDNSTNKQWSFEAEKWPGIDFPSNLLYSTSFLLNLFKDHSLNTLNSSRSCQCQFLYSVLPGRDVACMCLQI